MSLGDAVKLAQDLVPKVNPLIGNGLPYYQLKNSLQVIDRLMSTAFGQGGDELPTGFHYSKYEVLSPEDAAAERIKKSRAPHGRRRGYDLSRTDTFIVKYIFKNGNDTISRCIALPAPSRGGIIHIKGTRYSISNVIKTKGLAHTPKGYFVEFSSSKTTFERSVYTMVVNGKHIHTYLPYSKDLHHKTPKQRKANIPVVACWLFAKFGISETFKRYCNCDIKMFTLDDPELDKYRNQEKWAICQSLNRTNRTHCPNLAIVVAKRDFSRVTKVMISSLLYVLNHNKGRDTLEYIDDPATWRICLSNALFTDANLSTPRRTQKIEDHFRTLSRYVDTSFKMELQAENITLKIGANKEEEFVTDIFDFLFYVITCMCDRKGDDRRQLANMYGRYLTSVEYVTFAIRDMIFNTFWKLIQAAQSSHKKGAGGIVSTQNVQTVINTNITMDAIEWINNKNGEVNTISTATDNMLVSITAKAIMQEETRRDRKGGRSNIDIDDPAKHIHVSNLDTGSVVNVTKSLPYSYGTINQCINIAHNGKILPNPKVATIINRADADLRQKGT